MKFEDGRIVIDKPLTGLDELVIGVTKILDEGGIQYSLVAGYVAILLGRSRATEDIDLIVERFSKEQAAELATALQNAGYWGSAMPLDEMWGTLTDDLNVRVSETGTRVPNVELKFPSDSYDRRSLGSTISVVLGDGESELRVGELELQIIYKLYLGSEKDFEDAIHLYLVTEETLNQGKLEEYATELGVEDEYEKLTRT